MNRRTALVDVAQAIAREAKTWRDRLEAAGRVADARRDVAESWDHHRHVLADGARQDELEAAVIAVNTAALRLSDAEHHRDTLTGK